MNVDVGYSNDLQQVNSVSAKAVLSLEILFKLLAAPKLAVCLFLFFSTGTPRLPALQNSQHLSREPVRYGSCTRPVSQLQLSINGLALRATLDNLCFHLTNLIPFPTNTSETYTQACEIVSRKR